MAHDVDPKGLDAAARAYARQMGKDPDACAFGHGEAGFNGGTFVCDVTNVEACTPSARQVVLAYLTATQPGEAEAGIVGRLHKRADQLGMLLSDPPKPHPDAVLIREAAAALTAAQQATARLQDSNSKMAQEWTALLHRAEAAEAKLAALQRELDQAREAMRPFAEFADFLTSETEGFAETDDLLLMTDDEKHRLCAFKVGDFRRVRTVLQENGK